MHVAMIGTRGVPAQYGGFETAVEEVGYRLVDKGHDVTVYCRNVGQTVEHYRGMRLVNLPALRRRSVETLSHSALSIAHCLRDRPDVAILFNAGNAPLIPLLKAQGVPTAVHMDGLEWKRAKWAGFGARYYKRAEELAARWGLALIADAQGIADHLLDAYSRESHLISYGAPIIRPGAHRLAEIGVKPTSFHLVVARLEPENHVDLILHGYRRSRSSTPLLVVGSAPYQDSYIGQLREIARHTNVQFLGAVWDSELLNQLYGHSLSYFHGHSVGGTNPSLLRALGAGAPVTAYDVNFNREVTGGHARFFTDEAGVATAIAADEADTDGTLLRGERGRIHVAEKYRWDEVADQYEQMLKEISSARVGLGSRIKRRHR